MEVSYGNGAIIAEGEYYKPTLYDVSNNLLMAEFDGTGGIKKYSVVNKWDFLECWYNQIFINGRPIDPYMHKKVSMVGKRMVIELENDDVALTVSHFTGSNVNALFTEFSVQAKNDVKFENTVNFGINFTSYLKNLFASRFNLTNVSRLVFDTLGAEIKGHRSVKRQDGFLLLSNNIIEGFHLDIAVSEPAVALETTHMYTNQFSATLDLKKGEKGAIKLVISGYTHGDFSACDVGECFRRFEDYRNESIEYVNGLPVPESCKTEFDKAYFASLYNCSLSMYKETGAFKGFLAGINYQSPARTYFRDGYWTALAVLKHRPELVRNEILTLARGIDKDGRCPSAVKYNFKNWWGDHYDSPSFYAILVYDYVRTTGDYAVLDVKWRKGTVLDSVIKVVEKLSESVDATGLLYKAGEYNRRDWCDNVFRTGYCTYDEALYARALYAVSEMTSQSRPQISKDCRARFEIVKKAINDILWDTERGYFVNYKTENYVEDNLSIDTVLVVLFGLTDNERATSVLNNMERMLESKNNKEQGAGDFGVLSVYPFYKNPRATVLKSSLPFYYHNGGDWPYWSAVYAYAKLGRGMDYEYPLTRWFTYNAQKGNYTPVEFFAPPREDGSLLQGWSGFGAFVYSYPDGKFFD